MNKFDERRYVLTQVQLDNLISAHDAEKKQQVLKAIGKDENLYQKERDDGNWDWRVQREEGANELRAELRQAVEEIYEVGND